MKGMVVGKEVLIRDYALTKADVDYGMKSVE